MSASLHAKYDRNSDVLYISAKREAAIRGIEDRSGIVWRYGSGGDLIGATIIDYFDLWRENKSALVKEIAEKFHVDTGYADELLKRADSE
jgi:uncharacterized protein YuzE